MHNRKRLIPAVAGFLTGLAMLWFFRSLPIAAGTAAAIVIAILVLKHVALAIVIGSPLASLFQSLKPGLRRHCPFAPHDD